MTTIVLENEDGTTEELGTLPEASEEAEATQTPPESSEASESTTEVDTVTFAKADLDKLRDEAAQGRTKAKRFDALAGEFVKLVAGRVLTDAADLELTADLLTEDGLPDADKITAAAEALAQARPALAKVRGSVAQGVHTPQSDSGEVDLHSMMRGW